MSIFREYDIRGIFGEDLNKNVVVQIGAELGREIMARGGRSVGIGYDARKHSPILFKWLCEGLGNSPLELHSADLANFGHSQTISLVSRPKFAKNYESQTENPSVVLNVDSTESKNSPSLAEGARGWVDSTKTTKSPQDARISELQTSELQIYDLGMIPTPVAYFSLYMENGVDSSIMITGSHNPPQYNGFKITILKKPFYGDDIRKFGEKILLDSTNAESSAFTPKAQNLDALNEYINFLTSHFKNLKNFPHKVAFDCGNGVAGIALKSILQNLNIPHLPLFFEPNGDFPNHHPDPSEDKNLIDLQNAMKENDIKIGIAFDGDADRIGLLTQSYHFKGDELAILFAKQIAKSSTKPPIKPVVIGEVKCSAIMYSEINKFGNAIMHKTGHSNLKVKLAETNAHLAAEMSGHIFFNDRYFGYDDAIYASLRALELFLDSSIEGVENTIKSLPQMFSTSEEKIDSSEDKKFDIIKKLAKKLNKIRSQQSANQNESDSQNAPQNFPKIIDIIEIDGIRVVFENGWGLIRASNTTPVLVTRFEAISRECAELYKAKMLSLLGECEKDLR